MSRTQSTTAQPRHYIFKGKFVAYVLLVDWLCQRILCVFAALQLRVMDCQLCSRGIFANLPMKIRTNLQQLCIGQSVHVNIVSPLAQG